MTRPDAVSVELEVPFHDVDALKIVWHGHYLKYLEIGRTAYVRSRGLDMADVMGLGYRMLVMEVALRYSFPLRYADRLRVTTWCHDKDHRINLGCEVFNLTHNRRSARGHCKLVTTDAAGNLLYETPDAIRNLLG